MRHFFSAIAALVLTAAQAGAQTAVDDILAGARADCESFEGGVFDPGNAVNAVDLTGDGALDSLVDEGAFSCTSAASLGRVGASWMKLRSIFSSWIGRRLR